jgi:signal peptidase I
MNGTKAIILALLAAFVLKLFVFDFMIARGHSMEPAIHDGNVLVISLLSYGLRVPFRQSYLVRWGQPKPEEIVVFYTPSGELAVKRCVSLSGEAFTAEGDNKLVSYDSRSYGPVPLDNIIGKVLGY